jgi:hypothetical protein
MYFKIIQFFSTFFFSFVRINFCPNFNKENNIEPLLTKKEMKKQNQQSAKKSKLTQNQHVVPQSNQKDEDAEKK